MICIDFNYIVLRQSKRERPPEKKKGPIYTSLNQYYIQYHNIPFIILVAENITQRHSHLTFSQVGLSSWCVAKQILCSELYEWNDYEI